MPERGPIGLLRFDWRVWDGSVHVTRRLSPLLTPESSNQTSITGSVDRKLVVDGGGVVGQVAPGLTFERTGVPTSVAAVARGLNPVVSWATGEKRNEGGCASTDRGENSRRNQGAHASRFKTKLDRLIRKP